MPLILALGMQRQVDLCEFKASLVYRASARIVSKAAQRNLVVNTPPQKKSHTGIKIRKMGKKLELYRLTSRGGSQAILLIAPLFLPPIP